MARSLVPLIDLITVAVAVTAAACGSTPVVATEEPAREIVGIGVELGMAHEGTEFATPTIAKLALTGPAAAAGVARHDTIWSIEGRETTGMTRAAVQALLEGPRGTVVRLRVGRSRGLARDVTVTRAPLPKNTLSCESGDCQAGTGASVDMWGERYEGEFKAGVYHGKGRLVRSDGQVHDGRFAGGALDGSGSIEMPNGDRFVGTFVNGEPRDIKIILANGDFYEGATLGFEMHGQGRLQRPDRGDVWEGRYEHGKLVEGTWLHYPATNDGRSCVRAIAKTLLARTATVTFAPGDPKRRTTYEGEVDGMCRANGKGVMRYSDKKKGFAGTYLVDVPQADVKAVE